MKRLIIGTALAGLTAGRALADASDPIIAPASTTDGGLSSNFKNQNEPAAVPTVPDTGASFFQRATLLGDWGGARPWLENHGINFSPVYSSEIMGELNGSHSGNRVVYAHNLDLPLEIDLDKFAGWRDALFHVNAFWIAGRGLSEDGIGDLANVSNIAGYRTIRLNEMWLEQKFLDQKFSLKAGNIAVDTEFFGATAAALFINSSFGTFSLVAANVANTPIYPMAVPAGRVAYQTGAHWNFQAGLFDGAAGAQDVNKNGTDFHLARGDGALIFSEMQFIPHPDADKKTLGNIFKVGGFLHTKRTQTWSAQLGGSDSGGSVDYGIYGVVEQDLFKRDGKRVSAFARGGGAPGNRNVIGWYIDAGVNFTGFLPGRDNDIAGIAFARSSFSKSFSDYSQARDGTDRLNSEMIIETTYKAQLTPCWTLQPDLQCVLTPGGERNSKTAIVLGLRTAVSF